MQAVETEKFVEMRDADDQVEAGMVL